MRIVNPRDPYEAGRVVGHCEECAEELNTLYDIYRDEEGHRFCSKECAMQYWGIELISDDVEDFFEEE